MALVEKYHVVAAVRPVATGETIKEGQIVALDDSGNVILECLAGTGKTLSHRPYGIAGDTKRTDASNMPGVYSGWQNRVSDYFDETRASGKMTVYHSGGEFATDQFSGNVGSLLPGVWLYARNGVLDDKAQGGGTTPGVDIVIVGMLTQAAAVYPSGVPGIDVVPQNDVALGGETYSGVPPTLVTPSTNEYIEFKLMI